MNACWVGSAAEEYSVVGRIQRRGNQPEGDLGMACFVVLVVSP